MKNLTLITRFVMGIMLIVFGANKFFHFMPMPELSGGAANLMSAFVSAGYFMPILGVIMLLTGLSILFNKYSALMLLVMAPITVNILLFHLILDPVNMMMGVILGVLHVIMIFSFRKSYANLFLSHSGIN